MKTSIGAIGTAVPMWTWFSNANVAIGVIVGALTAVYMSLQIYFLLKNKGKK